MYFNTIRFFFSKFLMAPNSLLFLPRGAFQFIYLLILGLSDFFHLENTPEVMFWDS